MSITYVSYKHLVTDVQVSYRQQEKPTILTALCSLPPMLNNFCLIKCSEMN